MKKETRTKTVEYEVYIAKDGKEFENEKECIFYEMKLNGEIIDCKHCNGRGYHIQDIIEEDYHTGAPYHTAAQIKCEHCHGKGYLEKAIVWR